MLPDGEEPRMKRLRTSLTMLPDDVLLNCLARVSRFYYPTLSLVSKRFRSLVASRDLYETKILLGCTESCLYICLQLPPDRHILRWFIISQRPNSSRKVLVPIPCLNSTRSAVAAVGPYIYVIGGGSKENASSSVMVTDSRSHSHAWREAPSMRVPRVLPSACTLDGKIYVTGGCDHLDSTNWMEVFDTKTQTWEFLQIPSEEICGGSQYLSSGYEGTIYVKSEEKRLTCKLHKGRWRRADLGMCMGWHCHSLSSFCVIDNVFYRYSKQIKWYDLKTRLWKTLQGVEGLPRLTFPKQYIKLADHGGKMAILWEEYVSADHKKMIWCGEIALQNLQNGEIRGTLEWLENLLTCPAQTGLWDFVYALIATV